MSSLATIVLTKRTRRKPVINHAIAKVVVLYKRTRKFTRVLGPLEGLRALAGSIVGTREILVRLPNVRQPIVIRPRTTDRFVFEQIFLDGDYELPFYLSPRLILDAGANVGFASIFFANKYPSSTIIALEPDPVNFDALIHNTRGYSQILPMRVALWNKCELLSLNSDRDSWSCCVESLGNSRTIVQGITVIELLRRHGYESADIVKIDIEGAESEVFDSDCRAWLATTKILIVELHDHLRAGCFQRLRDAIKGLGFRQMERGENTILVSPCL
jgi:FkbM family methyltransferase